MNRKNFNKIFAWGILAGGFVAAALIVISNAFYGKAVSGDASLYIYPQTEYSCVADSVKSYIATPLKRKAFDFYASHLNLEKRLKTGHYSLEQDMSVIEAVRMLALGNQTAVNLVVGHARTLPQLAGKLSKQIMADSVSMLSALRNKELKKSLGYVNDSIIATFIPNTYQVYWNISPEKLLERMKRESDSFWNSDRKAKAKSVKLSEYQVITLASIVYEETKNRAEMPKIAGVYINRLRRGIPLQACPTVKYAMGDFELRRILYKHLRYQSPFNTYRNVGLPPAPICIPSIAAIDAVLNYEKSDYLYFCARPEFDGTHNFARTLREHNANSRKYNQALKQLNK